MDIRTTIILTLTAWTIFLAPSCGNKYCPQTNGGSAETLDILLLDRKDTISLGDTVLFESFRPILPFTYQNMITWDENATIQYQLSCGKLDTTSPDTLDGFMDYITSTAPIPDSYYGPRIRSYRQTLGYDDFLRVSFLPLDTGNYWISFFIKNLKFSDSEVPDYKGSCERNVEFYGNFKNLYQQPVMEHFSHPYQYIQCIASTCDTLVYTYGFRVEP